MTRTKLLLLFITLLLLAEGYSQYPIFNINQTSSMLDINPAFAGEKRCARLGLNQLYQHNYENNGYFSTLATFDSHIDILEGDVGLKISDDRYIIKDNNNLSISGIYAYSIPLSRNFTIKTAIQANFLNNQLDVRKFRDRYNNSQQIFFDEGMQISNKNSFSLGGGVICFSRNYVCGVSVDHINRPVEGSINSNKVKLPIKYSVFGGGTFKVGRSGALYPTLVYQFQNNRYFIDTIPIYLLNNMQHISFNINCFKKSFMLGAGYKYIFDRPNISTVQVGYKFSKFTIAYNASIASESSFDKMTSFHQISIDFQFRCKQKKQRFRTISCPSFGGSTSGSYYANNITPICHSSDNINSIDNNTEEYDRIYDNSFKDVKNNPLSTFSIDVDNASYSNSRRFINSHQLPDADVVRIEEFINYFDYDYPEPKDEVPFSINTEFAKCPWNSKHNLLHIGIQGKKLDYENIKPSNLVFLIDVSGSMSNDNKLPLLKRSIKLLLDELGENDRVALVVYASSTGVVLQSTPITNKEKILNALNRLNAGGSTAGRAGIKLAYKIAKENLIEGGNNRVILATDGDFNVGVSSTSELVRLIEDKRKDDIYLTICGFGMGNYKDGRMEQISNAGNGNYFYIDNINEAKKVFVTEMRANMFTVAKDVKIQIEFNPLKVKEYRLIGYENRVLKDEDFNNDKIDAGEIGPGHNVTALYEIIPVGVNTDSLLSPDIDELRYQEMTIKKTANKGNEISTIKIRYKEPKDTTSILINSVVKDKTQNEKNVSENFMFCSAVAQFGLLLRDSEYKGNSSYFSVLELARLSKGKDENGNRSEFIKLVEACEIMSKEPKKD